MIDQPDRPDGDGLRSALEQIKIVCIDNAATTVRHDLALEFVGSIATHALKPIITEDDGSREPIFEQRPTRDGAEGACPNCGSTAPNHNFGCFRAPSKPAPDAIREALKPFAKAADGASSVQRADDFIIWQEITIGDLRCAKAALSAPVPPADELTEIVLEECENLAGGIIQTVHLVDGKEVVRSAPSPTIDKTKLYTVLSKSIPADMIDSIWQELNQ